MLAKWKGSKKYANFIGSYQKNRPLSMSFKQESGAEIIAGSRNLIKTVRVVTCRLAKRGRQGLRESLTCREWHAGPCGGGKRITRLSKSRIYWPQSLANPLAFRGKMQNG